MVYVAEDLSSDMLTTMLRRGVCVGCGLIVKDGVTAERRILKPSACRISNSPYCGDVFLTVLSEHTSVECQAKERRYCDSCASILL